jgi:hypothetical protein
MAGLLMLGYYNSIAGFCDILPSDDGSEDILGYPQAKCERLLAAMQKRYPESRFWAIEEARIYAKDGQPVKAIKILEKNADSKIKQIAALNLFEKSMTAMFLHDYPLCTESFISCIEMNTWSHSLYYFIAGTAQVEQYRDLRLSNPKTAAEHKKKATEYIRKAPTLAGKKRLLAKQLPFDIYVIRKVQKWEERAKAWNVDLVDAIGVSPLEEMMYLWNGTKKMSAHELNDSLKNLDMARATHPEKLVGNIDESGMRALLVSSVYRSQKKYAEARDLLQTEVLCHDKAAFKGHLCDDWTPPSATYEMAAIAWAERDLPGVNSNAKVAECEAWTEKAAKWESYVLDARMGLKITTAQVTLMRRKASML